MSELDHAVVEYARVSDEPIVASGLTALVDDERAGAIATFTGAVRNHDSGRRVTALSYSAHPSAEQVLAQVAQEFISRPKVHRLAVAHRVGDLEIGDVALFVAVAASHREQAFACVEDLVNRVKDQVPIWKHQTYADGSSSWPGSDDAQRC